MSAAPRFTAVHATCLALVVSLAGGARAWFLLRAADGGTVDAPVLVQGTGLADEVQAANPNIEMAKTLASERKFDCRAPLSDKIEPSAHVAPLYPWLISLLYRVQDDAGSAVRWAQAVLGALSAGCIFLFACRAFGSLRVATLAGILVAFSPFAVINVAEIADGVLASFLVCLTLYLGLRGSQSGGPFASMLFGLALAGLCVTRGAFILFALVALVWFLWQCRSPKVGWFAGLLAFLGFANGVAPWTLRNYQTFGEPVPVVSSAYLHLWMGHGPSATGGMLAEDRLRSSFDAERLKSLLDEPNQLLRYEGLCHDVARQFRRSPTENLNRRIDAALAFGLGESWMKNRRMASWAADGGKTTMPEWLVDAVDPWLVGAWLAMVVLGFLGWRWSHSWRKSARLGTLAMVFLPLPYLLSHAEYLAGPRLPLEGVLWCYVAYALAYFTPNFVYEPQEVT